jgi:hypothetical protein
MPRNGRANDLWHWQIKVTSEVDAAVRAIRAARRRFVSAGVATLPDDRLGFTRGFLARDPDGHALLFTQR